MHFVNPVVIFVALVASATALAIPAKKATAGGLFSCECFCVLPTHTVVKYGRPQIQPDTDGTIGFIGRSFVPTIHE